MGEISSNIEGIGNVTEQKLVAVGIKTLEDMRTMDVPTISTSTGISATRLNSWKSMAVLQQIEGIDKQYAEGLVRSGVTGLRALTTTDAATMIGYLDGMEAANVIPKSATTEQVSAWQDSALAILGELEQRPSNLSPEVTLVWSAMTCRGMRNHYDDPAHPCRWFNGDAWEPGSGYYNRGPYHAYDVSVDDLQKGGEGYMDAFYVGKRHRVPELLSGCRKAPIMSVGLNPNLRGSTDPQRIYPYFDDVQQFAKHFRYRTNFKYSIEDGFFDEWFDPATGEAAFETGDFVFSIPLHKEYVSMYDEYDRILQAFQARVGIEGAGLCLAEDVSYYNFVACHSPRWDMDSETERGIVDECFRNRQFFPRQFIQSSPSVVIIFGKAVMAKFVELFRENFDPANIPDAGMTYPEILANNDYVMDLEGRRVRVIFSSHPTGNRPYYLKIGAMEKIVEAMAEEYANGNLEYDDGVKHLARTDGPCEFCDNDLYYIGGCPYRKR